MVEIHHIGHAARADPVGGVAILLLQGEACHPHTAPTVTEPVSAGQVATTGRVEVHGLGALVEGGADGAALLRGHVVVEQVVAHGQ